MSQAFSENSSDVRASDNSNPESSAGISARESVDSVNGSSAPFVIEPPQSRPSSTKVTTDFRVRPDGTLVELVCRQGSAGNELRFLIWNGEAGPIVDHFEHDGRLYTPPILDERVSKLNLRLPCEVKACGSPEDLLVEISDLIRSHVDLVETSICLVAAFVMSTWFVDSLTVAPYLWLCGPPASGKTTLLRVLHCLCRRAVLIAGSIPSPIYSLPALLRPTMLFDDLRFNGTQHSHTLESWLRAGNARGVPVTVGERLADSFGAKVLCSRQPASDTALASRALHISMIPTRKNLQPLEEQTVERIANDFQPRLLNFRLENYREFRPADGDLSAFSPRMRDLLRALLSPLWGFKDALNTKKVLNSLVEALKDQERQAFVERAHEPEALVITALFWYCHQPETSAVFVGQIASSVNTCRKRIGEEADLKPRAVGSILKSLGLTTDKLDSFGRGLRLTVEVRRRIHGLLQAYNLKSEDPTRTRGCVICEEMMRTDSAGPAKGRVGATPQ